MKSDKELIHWLLQGDTAIQYQTRRDLLKASSTSLRKLQARISIEGWGARFLSKQDKKDLVAFMKACTGPFPKVESGRLPE